MLLPVNIYGIREYDFKLNWKLCDANCEWHSNSVSHVEREEENKNLPSQLIKWIMFFLTAFICFWLVY